MAHVDFNRLPRLIMPTLLLASILTGGCITYEVKRTEKVETTVLSKKPVSLECKIYGRDGFLLIDTFRTYECEMRKTKTVEESVSFKRNYVTEWAMFELLPSEEIPPLRLLAIPFLPIDFLLFLTTGPVALILGAFASLDPAPVTTTEEKKVTEPLKDSEIVSVQFGKDTKPVDLRVRKKGRASIYFGMRACTALGKGIERLEVRIADSTGLKCTSSLSLRFMTIMAGQYIGRFKDIYERRKLWNQLQRWCPRSSKNVYASLSRFVRYYDSQIAKLEKEKERQARIAREKREREARERERIAREQAGIAAAREARRQRILRENQANRANINALSGKIRSLQSGQSSVESQKELMNLFEQRARLYTPRGTITGDRNKAMEDYGKAAEIASDLCELVKMEEYLNRQLALK